MYAIFVVTFTINITPVMLPSIYHTRHGSVMAKNWQIFPGPKHVVFFLQEHRRGTEISL